MSDEGNHVNLWWEFISDAKGCGTECIISLQGFLCLFIQCTTCTSHMWSVSVNIRRRMFVACLFRYGKIRNGGIFVSKNVH